MMLWGKVVYSLISWVAGDLFAFFNLWSGTFLGFLRMWVDGMSWIIGTRFGLVI